MIFLFSISVAVLENWIFFCLNFKYLGAKMSLIKFDDHRVPRYSLFDKINNALEMRMIKITVLLNKNKTHKMT